MLNTLLSSSTVHSFQVADLRDYPGRREAGRRAARKAGAPDNLRPAQVDRRSLCGRAGQAAEPEGSQKA